MHPLERDTIGAEDLHACAMLQRATHLLREHPSIASYILTPTAFSHTLPATTPALLSSALTFHGRTTRSFALGPGAALHADFALLPAFRTAGVTVGAAVARGGPARTHAVGGFALHPAGELLVYLRGLPHEADLLHASLRGLSAVDGVPPARVAAAAARPRGTLMWLSPHDGDGAAQARLEAVVDHQRMCEGKYLDALVLAECALTARRLARHGVVPAWQGGLEAGGVGSGEGMCEGMRAMHAHQGVWEARVRNFVRPPGSSLPGVVLRGTVGVTRAFGRDHALLVQLQNVLLGAVVSGTNYGLAKVSSACDTALLMHAGAAERVREVSSSSSSDGRASTVAPALVMGFGTSAAADESDCARSEIVVFGPGASNPVSGWPVSIHACGGVSGQMDSRACAHLVGISEHGAESAPVLVDPLQCRGILIERPWTQAGPEELAVPHEALQGVPLLPTPSVARPLAPRRGLPARKSSCYEDDALLRKERAEIRKQKNRECATRSNIARRRRTEKLRELVRRAKQKTLELQERQLSLRRENIELKRCLYKTKASPVG